MLRQNGKERNEFTGTVVDISLLQGWFFCNHILHACENFTLFAVFVAEVQVAVQENLCQGFFAGLLSIVFLND